MTFSFLCAGVNVAQNVEWACYSQNLPHCLHAEGFRVLLGVALSLLVSPVQGHKCSTCVTTSQKPLTMPILLAPVLICASAHRVLCLC